jgi:glutathione gamma-glutamylcysteinyltransferase
VNETHYRRPLPAGSIAFSSVEGRRLFAEALATGGLDGYFPIAEQFHTQSDPSFCGLGSLVVALNALGIDPGRLWKGPWRWFSEDLLDCCVPLDQVRRRGLDMDELACLARCNGADVEVHHTDASDVGAFRQAVNAAAAGTGVLIAAYHRASLDQTGAGHFSPIAGYHRERELVLVLDVARFKYPPHWVELTRLFGAMEPNDPATGRARGWLLLRGRTEGIALGFSIRCDDDGWTGLAERMDTVRNALTSAVDLGSLARAVVPFVPHVEQRTPASAAHREALERARGALRELRVHGAVQQALGDAAAEPATLLLLAIADLLPAARQADIDVLSPSRPEHVLLANEVAGVRAQLAALRRIAGESA